MDQDLINYLAQHLTEKRYALLKQIIQNRTRYLTVVLEDIYQSQNASAVLRSCDCFGIQDVHVIENRNKFDVNPKVSRGSSKWLSIHSYNETENNTLDAILKLKAQGYRIVATSPYNNDVQLENFDLNDGKSALVFGTEMHGISEEVKKHTDVFLKIPMYGFTESFNISVSAAIILHHLTFKLHQSDIHWKLSAIEQNELFAAWLATSIKSSDLIIEDFYRKRNL